MPLESFAASWFPKMSKWQMSMTQPLSSNAKSLLGINHDCRKSGAKVSEEPI